MWLGIATTCWDNGRTLYKCLSGRQIMIAYFAKHPGDREWEVVRCWRPPFSSIIHIFMKGGRSLTVVKVLLVGYNCKSCYMAAGPASPSFKSQFLLRRRNKPEFEFVSSQKPRLRRRLSKLTAPLARLASLANCHTTAETQKLFISAV